jgi:hypothetical protein
MLLSSLLFHGHGILPPRYTLVLYRNRNGSQIELVEFIRHTRYRRCDWLERTFRQHITPFTVLRRHGRERESGLLCDGKLQTRCILRDFNIFHLLYNSISSSKNTVWGAGNPRHHFTSTSLNPDQTLDAHWRAPSENMPVTYNLTVLQLLCLSGPASVLLRHYVPALSLGLISTPIVLFLTLFFAKIAWAVVIYPKFFSPLRHLPTPDDNAFFTGQTKRVFREAGGRPMRHWIETVKNDGLITYMVWFRERVLVTDPKTLGEVLVTKVCLSRCERKGLFLA